MSKKLLDMNIYRDNNSYNIRASHSGASSFHTAHFTFVYLLRHAHAH